jgi:antitoxin component YwqK of YwqJK toxin-antitoxin module
VGWRQKKWKWYVYTLNIVAGILFYQNGEICYSGQWKDDKYHGKGVEYNENPQMLKSSFNYKDFAKLKRFIGLF